MSADSLEENFICDFKVSEEILPEEDTKNTKSTDITLVLKEKELKYIGTISDYKRLNPKENTLIIAASALKCTSILSELKYLKRKIGKLFSRHLKVQDQTRQLQENATKVNVGTPNRILKLLDQIKIKKVIIDTSRDTKGFSILDLKDTRKDLLDLLDNLDKSVRIFLKT